MKLIKYIGISIILLVSLNLTGQQTVGTFKNDSLAYDGLTLIAPGASRNTYLIDNCGSVVNEWSSDFFPGAVAYLLPNGDLLRTCRIAGSFNGGGAGGRVELHDWDNNLKWAYDFASSTYHQHHDVEFLPNGNLLVLMWDRLEIEDVEAIGRIPGTVGNQGLWAERIWEVEMVGFNQINIVWEWSVWDHIIQDADDSKPNFGVIGDNPGKMDINYPPSAGNQGGDWIHMNAIDYNPDLDQIILSSRVLNEVWVIDHSTTTEEATSDAGGNSGKGGDILYRWGNPQVYDRGTSADQKLYGQHDAHWIETGLPDEGKIMMFNNGRGRPGGDYSSIDIIDPPVNGFDYSIDEDSPFGPADLYYTYTSLPVGSLFSSRISSAQRLPNGNTLICEGEHGRFIEIDQDDITRWEYIVPISSGSPVPQESNPGNNDTFRAYRYGKDWGELSNFDLEPGIPLETDPIDYGCKIYNTLTSTIDIVDSQTLMVYPNPVSEVLYFDQSFNDSVLVRIFDLQGRELLNNTINNSTINVASLNSGNYIVSIIQTSSGKRFVGRFVKI